MNSAHDMDVPHRLEDRGVRLDEGAGRDRAGVVDEDGDGPASSFGRRHLALDLDRVGDIGDAAARGLAGGHGRAQRRLAASDHGHGGAGAGERGGDRAADAASPAGDQSVLACERHIPAGRESCSGGNILSLKFTGFKLVARMF